METLQSSRAGHSAGAWLRLIVYGIAAGILVTVLLSIVIGLERKLIAVGVLGIGLVVVSVALHRVREVFLFAWVISLTYNRQFWSFAPVVGDHGAFGPYWMLADLLFLVLITIWLYEVILLKRTQPPHARSFIPWLAPFFIAAGLSIASAPEPAWSLGDFLRLCKLGLILMYFRFNVGPREWWVLIAGLGAAVVIQASFGMLEVVSGRTGVLWIIGLGGPDVSSLIGMQQEEIFGGWTRATGTVAHPPYLAAFFLLTVPIFMAFALTLKSRTYRWLSIAVAVFGLAGLMCTLARLPIVVMMGQIGLLFILLTGLRMTPITRILAASTFAGLVLSAIALFGAELIYDRLSRDLESSVDQRVAEYKVALDMLMDHPFFGVGLNNYAAFMEEYGSSTVWGIKQKWHDVATQLTHMRLLPGPLNGFLYVATVTGTIGLATFLWLAFGGLVLSRRGIRNNSGPVRAACIGMLVGMVGLYLHQALSYSIWIDTVITVWIVLIGLAGCAAANTGRTGTAAVFR